MAKATYWQKGDKIDYKNSGSTVIESGEIVAFGSMVGIAGMDIPVGAIGTLVLSGVFKMPKATGAITAGAKVYYDAAAGNITETASSNTPAGIAVAAAGSSDADVLVRLMAV